MFIAYIVYQLLGENILPALKRGITYMHISRQSEQKVLLNTFIVKPCRRKHSDKT